MPESALSSCLQDPTSEQANSRKKDYTACMQGITDAAADLVLGPALIARETANFVEKFDSTCRGDTKEFRAERDGIKHISEQFEQSFMLQRYGLHSFVPGTWESLTCDELTKIQFCNSSGQYMPETADMCVAVSSLQSTAEKNFSQSVFSKFKPTKQKYQIAVAPHSYSSGIVKNRLADCQEFKQKNASTLSEERKYLKDLRASIAKDGSCGEAFDSIISGMRGFMTEAQYSEYTVSETAPPNGCYSDEYLSKRYCQIAADIAMNIGPMAVGKLVNAVSKVPRLAGIVRSELAMSRKIGTGAIIDSQILDEKMTNGYLNLSKTSIYDKDSIYIGVSNHLQEGNHHYYLIAGNSRYDGMPFFDRSEVRQLGTNVPIAKGVLFKIPVAPDQLKKVEVAILKDAESRNLSCLHGLCRVLDDADIQIGDWKKGDRVRVKTIATGLLQGEVKSSGAAIDATTMKLYSTSQDQLVHFLRMIPRADRETAVQIAQEAKEIGLAILPFAGAGGGMVYVIYRLVEKKPHPK